MDKIASKLQYLKGFVKGMEINGSKNDPILNELIDILELIYLELEDRKDHFSDYTMQRSDFSDPSVMPDVWYDNDKNIDINSKTPLYSDTVNREENILFEKLCKHCGTYIKAEFSPEEYKRVKIRCPRCRHYILTEETVFNWENEEPLETFESIKEDLKTTLDLDSHINELQDIEESLDLEKSEIQKQDEENEQAEDVFNFKELDIEDNIDYKEKDSIDIVEINKEIENILKMSNVDFGIRSDEYSFEDTLPDKFEDFDSEDEILSLDKIFEKYDEEKELDTEDTGSDNSEEIDASEKNDTIDESDEVESENISLDNDKSKALEETLAEVEILLVSNVKSEEELSEKLDKDSSLSSQEAAKDEKDSSENKVEAINKQEDSGDSPKIDSENKEKENIPKLEKTIDKVPVKTKKKNKGLFGRLFGK